MRNHIIDNLSDTIENGDTIVMVRVKYRRVRDYGKGDR
jgi:hypothetical protein